MTGDDIPFPLVPEREDPPPDPPPRGPHDPRPECDKRFQDIEKKMAVGSSRFQELDRRSQMRSEGTDQRIDDLRGHLSEDIQGVEKRTREDIRGLESKMDSRHGEVIAAIGKIPAGSAETSTEDAIPAGVWARLPGFLKVLIVVGIVLGTAAATVVGALAGVGPG